MPLRIKQVVNKENEVRYQIVDKASVFGFNVKEKFIAGDFILERDAKKALVSRLNKKSSGS